MSFKTKTTPALLMLLLLAAAKVYSGTPAMPGPVSDVQAYVLQKLKHHSLLLMGTTHKQTAILESLIKLLPHLKSAGATHLALEIASDQQEQLNHYLATGQGLKYIKLHPAIDCPGYRSLLQALRRLPSVERPKVEAIDLPPSAYDGPVDRDLWMAQRLEAIIDQSANAKIIVIAGSLHVLRRLKWQAPIQTKHQSIQTHLRGWRPELSIFAIVNIAGSAKQRCDFGRMLGQYAGSIAMDLDSRFKGWTLGLTRCIAIAPAEPYELVDGVIVY